MCYQQLLLLDCHALGLSPYNLLFTQLHADCFLYYLYSNLTNEVFALVTNSRTENHYGNVSSVTHLFPA